MALAALSPDVQRFSEKFGLEGSLSLLSVAWEREMGAWSSMARLTAIQQHSLVVEVSTSAAMQEISLRRKELLRRLNAHFPRPWIKMIAVRFAHPHGNGD